MGRSAPGGRRTSVKRTVHETRAGRARRDLLKRVVLWIFIAFFALSAAGAAFIVGISH
jgi:hypothetical protein